ncbi:MAG: imidazole glycerol phosphate synthase subunit HisF [Melioribacteraceae bacterium]|nr:MAG: imidazole glycerol phosphate synthase subunit HisF [Melioribacteraceae bacterium]
MPAKRIIPCLDVKNGDVVKGTNFVNLKYAGNAIELARKYSEVGADELIFLDITATLEKRKTLLELVNEVSKVIRIPFTVGGGISEIQDIDLLLKAGADKISLNSAIVRNPQLITDAASIAGSQAVVAAIDVKKVGKKYKVFINAGKTETEREAIEWCKEVEELGAGEILLTSMDKDGTRSGFDIELLLIIQDVISIPLIASGGAGNTKHFVDLFAETDVDAALAAGIFHYGDVEITLLKNELAKNNIEIRT